SRRSDVGEPAWQRRRIEKPRQQSGDPVSRVARCGAEHGTGPGCPYAFFRTRACGPERYRSGQTGQTVNLLAHAFGGSNPPLSTTKRKAGAEDATRTRPAIRINLDPSGPGRIRQGQAGPGQDAPAVASTSTGSEGRRRFSRAGIAQLARARAFQARGRGFE